jgi:hypothetical protein
MYSAVQHSSTTAEVAGPSQPVFLSFFFAATYITELQYKTMLRREGADTLNVYMCDLRQGQGMWGYTYLPTALKDWPEYDGLVISNPFTKPDGHTYVARKSTKLQESPCGAHSCD